MKAIMIVDMPENCAKCDYLAENYDGDNICALKSEDEHYKIIENVDRKPDWCPLRELPEAKSEEFGQTIVNSARAEGWNACLREITGN